MLIHVVRYTFQQHQIKDMVYREVQDLKNKIQYSDTLTLEEFHAIWVEDYAAKSNVLKMDDDFKKFMIGCTELNWDEVWNELKRFVLSHDELDIYEVNGKSTDSLIYKNHEGKPYNVIVIGGDKLSRGLTLEGLTISYFTRSTGTADTLMQMGRWFGFRNGYLDLCRLFTTEKLNRLFKYVSFATNNLASQFDKMNDGNYTPYTFGLKVATDPDILLSARNKIRTGKEFSSDFSGSLTQTRLIDIDPQVVKRNIKTVGDFVHDINDTPYIVHNNEEYQSVYNTNTDIPGKHYFWHDIEGYKVAAFLDNFITSTSARRANSSRIAEYIRELNKHDGLNKFTVCLINEQGTGNYSYNIGGIEGIGIMRSNSNSGKFNDRTYDVHALVSSDQEYYDYSSEQRKAVKDKREKYKGLDEDEINRRIRVETREYGKGLLIIYPITNTTDAFKLNEGDDPVIGLAVVFPARHGNENIVAYRFNDVALELENE